jgi:phage terminase large subunit-like protein
VTALLGSTRPRLFTPPLVPNSRGLPALTRGRDLIRFARSIGEPFWPWQEELALRGLELDETGHYRFGIVIVLVARQNGKTRFLRVLALWRLFEQRARLAVAAGQDRSRAFEVWEDAIEVIEAHPDLSKRLGKVWRRTNDEWFRVLDENGVPAGRYRIKAATRSSGRGPSADVVLFDELREQTDWEGWSALSKTTMARPDGQVWAFSNAGDRKAVVLRHLRAVALAGTDPSIGLMEYSAPDGCALDDRRGQASANPSLGRPGGITERTIRTAVASDPPEVFRTEVLCQFVDVLDHAVDPDAWMQSADPTLDAVRDDWVACVDVALDSEHVTLALAAVLPDGRVRTEVAAEWETTSEGPATERARRELPALLAAIKPRRVAWFPSGPAKPLAPILRPSNPTLAKRYPEIKGTAVGEACMGFADLVAARLIVHRNDPLLTAHVTGAQRLPEGDGWRFVRQGAAHVDAAYAAAGAVHVALTLPKPAGKPRILVAP